MLPFLGHHFSEVSHFEIYFQHAMERGQTVKPAHTWVPALIEEKRPAVVIDEIVGSLLHVEDPADILRRDGLGRD